jgi:thioredoxin 1
VLETSDDGFDRDVTASALPVLVDFWAPWCAPCKTIEPALAELERAYDGRIRVARINLDENLVTAARFSVLSLPTVIVFAGGKPRETLVGARSRSDYERAVDRVLTRR